MKMELSAGGVLALVGVAVAGVVLWKAAPKVREALATAAEKLNPANPDNVVATGVNAVGGAIVEAPDGPGKNADGSWTLGGWWRDVTSQDDERIRDMLKGGEAPRFVGGVSDPSGNW